MPATEAHRLPTNVRPRHYDLNLAPDLDAATFSGTVSIEIDVAEPTSQVVLHALDLDLHDVHVVAGGRRLDAEVTLDAEAETATLALTETVPSGPATLYARFEGTLNDMLVGFYRSTYTDPEGQTQTLACTQFESTHARRAFPCWDEPAFKASFAVTLEVPDHLLAVSNSAEVDRQPIDANRMRVRFAPTMVMSTYLVAFVVGPLAATETVDVDGVPLRVIAPPASLDLADFALEVGAFALRFLADWYDIAYPGDKLDLVAIPDFSFGAMENLGCVTFRETALLVDPARASQADQQRVADVVAHEIAHMWFGDLVTMGWWNGIWLNEAFATFMEMMTTDAFRPDWQRWVDFGLSRTAAFDTDSLSSTRPIEFEVVTAAEAEGMFDVLTYEKGASVVRMLQQYLGEGPFQAGIRRYLRTHALSNTETTDLWDAIEEASGEPVRQIMDSWIFRAGHPVISVADPDAADPLRLTVSQGRFSFQADPAAGVEAPDPHEVRSVPVVVRAGHGDEASLHRLLLDGPTGSIELDARPDWVVANHESNGFYRVELSDAALDAVGACALTSLSATERYGLVEDEWALLLAGRGSVPRVVGLLGHLANETDLSVWQRMIGVLSSLDRLAADDDRAALAERTRHLVGPALDRLGPVAQTDEAPRTTALRAALFDAAARLGHDGEQQATARRLFDELGRRPDATDPDMAEAVIRVVAATADEPTWEELRRRALAAHAPQERVRNQRSLADTQDQALVGRLCELVLTDEIRTQDGLFVLGRALANRHAAADVWAFIEGNWSVFGERFPSAALPRLLEGIRPITDASLARRVVDFLAAHPVPQGELIVRQHLERMWVSVALARRIGPDLAKLSR